MKLLAWLILIQMSLGITCRQLMDGSSGGSACTIKDCGLCKCLADGHYDCTSFPPQQDCLQFHQMGQRTSGIYLIKKDGFNLIASYCDMETMGGGWTVIQRRVDDKVDFNRNWHAYKVGFGILTDGFWLGNDNINFLTKKESELLINMRTVGETEMTYVKYYNFRIGDESTDYMLTVSSPSGNASSINNFSTLNNIKFTTKDNDNDNSSINCAVKWSGGWWYDYCWRYTYFNGLYKDIAWNYPEKLSFVEMKIRRKV